jgi:hypothetical protein
MIAEYPGLVTTIMMRVHKVLLCSAIRLPTQQPADQKKENGQEHTQYGHTPCFGAFLLLIHLMISEIGHVHWSIWIKVCFRLKRRMIGDESRWVT